MPELLVSEQFPKQFGRPRRVGPAGAVVSCRKFKSVVIRRRTYIITGFTACIKMETKIHIHNQPAPAPILTGRGIRFKPLRTVAPKIDIISRPVGICNKNLGNLIIVDAKAQVQNCQCKSLPVRKNEPVQVFPVLLYLFRFQKKSERHTQKI